MFIGLAGDPPLAARLAVASTLDNDGWLEDDLRLRWRALDAAERERRVATVVGDQSFDSALTIAGGAAIPVQGATLAETWLVLIQLQLALPPSDSALLLTGVYELPDNTPTLLAARTGSRLIACGAPPRCQLPAWVRRCARARS